jgi:hypothetical protein
VPSKYSTFEAFLPLTSKYKIKEAEPRRGVLNYIIIQT